MVRFGQPLQIFCAVISTIVVDVMDLYRPIRAVTPTRCHNSVGKPLPTNS